MQGHVHQVPLNQVQTLNQDIDYLELENRQALANMSNSGTQSRTTNQPRAALAVKFETVPQFDRMKA